LLDRRLYLPQEWGEDAGYAVRRRTCGVPQDIAFKTKPMLGWEMIAAVYPSGALRARWVTCEAALGRDTSLLDRLGSLGRWYFAEVPHDTQVWRQRPATAVPAWSGRGRPPTRTRLQRGEATPATVAQLAAVLPGDR
jgi:SRSO17 transposase